MPHTESGTLPATTTTFFVSRRRRRMHWINAHIGDLMAGTIACTGTAMALSALLRHPALALCALAGTWAMAGGIVGLDRFIRHMPRPAPDPEDQGDAHGAIRDPAALARAGAALLMGALLQLPLIPVLGCDWLIFAATFAVPGVFVALWERASRVSWNDEGLRLSDPLRDVTVPWDDVLVLEHPHLDEDLGTVQSKLVLLSRSGRFRTWTVRRGCARLRRELERRLPAGQFLSAGVPTTALLPGPAASDAVTIPDAASPR